MAAVTGVGLPRSLMSASSTSTQLGQAAQDADAAVRQVPQVSAPDADPPIGGPDLPPLPTEGAEEIDPNVAVDNLSQGMADTLAQNIASNPNIATNPQSF